LTSLPHLNELHFDNIIINDNVVTQISFVKNLTKLTLWNIRHVIGWGLINLSNLQDLNFLGLFFPKQSQYYFAQAHLSDLTQLTSLKLCQYTYRINHLSTLTNLEFLECNTCDISDESVLGWNFPKLITLNGKRNPRLTGAGFSNLISLETLDIEDFKGSFHFLSNLDNLTTLGINRTEIGKDPIELEFLGNLTKLENLYMNFCPYLTTLKPLMTLTSLTNLQLRGNLSLRSEVILLSKLTSLVLLQLSGIPINAENFLHFTSLTNLQRLDIRPPDGTELPLEFQASADKVNAKLGPCVVYKQDT